MRNNGSLALNRVPSGIAHTFPVNHVLPEAPANRCQKLAGAWRKTPNSRILAINSGEKYKFSKYSNAIARPIATP